MTTQPKQYRYKQTVEAIRYTGDNFEAVVEFCERLWGDNDTWKVLDGSGDIARKQRRRDEHHGAKRSVYRLGSWFILELRQQQPGDTDSNYRIRNISDRDFRDLFVLVGSEV